MADSGQSTGLKWVASASPSAVGTAAATGTADTFTRGDHVHAHEAAHIDHDTTWAAKGDLIAGTANDTAGILTVGTNDFVLTADSGQTTGMKWAAAGSGAMATDVLWDAKGDLAAGTGANTGTKVTVGTNGKILMADSNATNGVSWQADGMMGTNVSGGISETFSRYIINQAGVGLTSGTMKLALIWLPVCTVTTITFCSGTTGLTPGSNPHAWVALYDSSLGLLRQSTDDTGLTWAASTMKTFTLSSTYGITTAGLYYIGLMVVSGGGGTQPGIQGTGTLLTVGAPAALPALAGASTASLTTTAPSTAAAITPGNATWGMVS
jgi:hypothetical protein